MNRADGDGDRRGNRRGEIRSDLVQMREHRAERKDQRVRFEDLCRLSDLLGFVQRRCPGQSRADEQRDEGHGDTAELHAGEIAEHDDGEGKKRDDGRGGDGKVFIQGQIGETNAGDRGEQSDGRSVPTNELADETKKKKNGTRGEITRQGHVPRQFSALIGVSTAFPIHTAIVDRKDNAEDKGN